MEKVTFAQRAMAVRSQAAAGTGDANRSLGPARLSPKLRHPHRVLAVTLPAPPNLSFLLCEVGMELLCNAVLRIKRSTRHMESAWHTCDTRRGQLMMTLPLFPVLQGWPESDWKLLKGRAWVPLPQCPLCPFALRCLPLLSLHCSSLQGTPFPRLGSRLWATFYLWED